MKGSLEDHAVAAPRLLRRGRQPRYTIIGDSTDVAREQGYRRIVLDTNGTLLEAIALYERAGYERIDRYNDNPYAETFFAQEL